jgi:hypothetical protein
VAKEERKGEVQEGIADHRSLKERLEEVRRKWNGFKSLCGMLMVEC